MGHKELTLRLPVDYREDQLRQHIEKELGTARFSYRIENKSLDARKKGSIHWLLRVVVLSEDLRGLDPPPPPELVIPFKKRNGKVVVVGSGPAGFFSALVLLKAGFRVTLIERGTDVKRRSRGIGNFESTGTFDPRGNYAFGEGGAGTFSDGKLTSRSKHISVEKRFIISEYIKAGAPEEIRYMAHPHLGSDNLRRIVRNLRTTFLDTGGTIRFETCLKDLKIRKGTVTEAVTDTGGFEADYCIVAPGHSAYETYRMLIGKGVTFRPKNFAIGSRVEHPQERINRAQWGREELPGVKAAEYRLTSKGGGILPVYTFCMCPGGTVVPATAYGTTNIVNGMSLYRRAGQFANAACVAGISPGMLRGRDVSALEALEWLESLEESFYRFSGGFQAPCCSIEDFVHRRVPSEIVASSYPLGLKPAPLWEMLPHTVSTALREGLKEFNTKIQGFEKGSIMGLESKTSSPIQVLRERNLLCRGFSNLFVVGEGSGHAGGIISSGADGIKAAMHIIEGG